MSVKNKNRVSKNRREFDVDIFYNDGDSAKVVLTTQQVNALVTRCNKPEKPINHFVVKPKANDNNNV